MLDLRDVVLTIGGKGAERVLLRGADLHVDPGETVLVTGLDAQARTGLRDLVTGRVRPRYGTLRADDVLVHDAGDRLDPAALEELLSTVAESAIVVVLCSVPPAEETWLTKLRTLALDGGQLISVPTVDSAELVRLPVALLARRTEEELRAAGATAESAATVARVLVDAERRGHRSHGIALLPTYLRRIKAGGIVADATPELTVRTPSTASIDAGGGLGQVAAALAAQWCAEAAKEHGIASVAVHDNNHVGMMAAYRGPFQEHGVVGLLLNTSGPSVAAPGGKRPTLGSNAVCLVTPTSGAEPFCVDLATGVVAAGKIRDAVNRGATVPLGWVQDPSGRPTTDPSQLDAGGSIPLFGDYKGLGITVIAEVLAGALAAGRVSPDVNKQRKQLDRVMGCGQLFIGLSAANFATDDRPALDTLVDRLREAVLAGHDTQPPRPWFPDQLEEDNAAKADSDGVLVSAAVLDELGWEES